MLYTDEELKPYFAEVAKGYPVKQAAYNAGLDFSSKTFDDYEVRCHSLDLSCAAGALIKLGRLPVPDRWDGLFDEYRP